MRITLLIAFLFSMLPLFGQERDTLQPTPKFVSDKVDNISVDTTSGTAWITIGNDSTAYTFDPPDGAPLKNNNARDADRTTTRKDTSLTLELSHRYYPIIINDDDGNQYTVYPNGTIERDTYFNISDDYLSVTAGQVATFEEDSAENYGFDAKEHTEWHEQYEIIELDDSSKYFVANKSLATNQSDPVTLVFEDSIPQGNLTYQVGSGNSAQPIQLNGNSATITIPEFSSKGEYALYVYADNKRVGKLNIHVYDQKAIDVVIVPVASASLDSATINTAINDIFNEANIQVNVSTAAQWNNAEFTSTTLIDLPSDVTNFSKYSEDMRNLRDTYFDSVPEADKSKYYFFVVEGFNGSGTEEGYMVRGKGLGFVTKNATPQTYAHELGHGAGALAHTWKENGPEEGSTNNLMDYNGGSNLTLGQWEELRKLNLVPSFWDNEEDGMLRNPKCLDTIQLIGGYCEKDMKCKMIPYFRLSYSQSNTLRWKDFVKFEYYPDSLKNNIYDTYLWTYEGGKDWVIKHNGGSQQFSLNPGDTLDCDGRVSSYCNDSTDVLIPSTPPKAYDFLVYVAYPMDFAGPGSSDKGIGVKAYRKLMGPKDLQVGHTGICVIKSDTVTKRAKIDYYDFGRFSTQESALGNGVRRHFDLGYLNLFLDTLTSTFKIEYKDSIELKINEIPYFALHQKTYGRKEIAIAPVNRKNFENAQAKVLSPFYEACTFGFGDDKSFCTDFVHDVFTAGGIQMADISSIVSKKSNIWLMTQWLLKHDLDNKLMKYWDKGDPFLRDVSKSPLPINYAIEIKKMHPKFN